MSNYPDDIRSYDNYPSSPFYVERGVECYGCAEIFDEDYIETVDGSYYCDDCNPNNEEPDV